MPPTIESGLSQLATKVVDALQYLGGIGHVQQIRKVISAHALCSPSGVRCTLQHHCALSPQYRGRFDLFRPMPERGRGCWRLLDYAPQPNEINVVIKPHELAALLQGGQLRFKREFGILRIALQMPGDEPRRTR